MTDTTLQRQTGHQVLAAAGKRILRPGGRTATEELFRWAEFQPGDTVLELASSFGESAIALAQRFGVRVVGVEKNPDSVARARAAVAAAGLSDRIEILEGDIFRLDQIPGTYDYVLAEAILSMQSPAGKAQILRSVGDRLKPGGRFLSHELLARDRADEIHRDLAQAIHSNVTPISEADWLAACAQAGLVVERSQTGPMGLLDPRQMLRDEGLFGVLRIAWNILTRPAIRDRVLTMRRLFQRYQAELGHIILCARRSTAQESLS